MLFAASSAQPKSARQQPANVQPQEPAADDTALDTLKDAPPAPVLACTGPFVKDTTHAKLVAAFGESNAALRQVDAADGSKQTATVLFENDPVKQITVIWRNASARSTIASIAASAPSTWVGPGGIRNGLPLKEVERLNGGSFNITGFEGAAGGLASGFKGQLAPLPGGCVLTVRFEPGVANPLPKKFAAILGDKKIPSSDKLMRRAKPMVSEWNVSYN